MIDGEQPRTIYPDQPVTSWLPGTVIYRHTETIGSRAVRAVAALPCHEQQTVVMPAAGTERAHVICRVCSMTFLLSIVDEGDGGHGATFVIADQREAYTISSARKRSR